MTIVVECHATSDRAAVEAFYRRELGRDVALGPAEELVVAWSGAEIVGALRLFPEAGTLVLRTVVVAADRRGEGIGRALLRRASAAIGARECFCFPWSYLERFYGAIGLRRIAVADVPAELRHRLGDETIAIHRAAGR